MEGLTKTQEDIERDIHQIINNYKKDPADRKKNVEYFVQRLQRLENAWKRFEENDNEIRMLPDLDTRHQYFVSENYKNMKNVCAKIDEWEEPGNSKPKAKIETVQTTRQDVEGRGSHPSGETDSIATQISRQRAMMVSLRRLIERIHDIEPSATISKTQFDSINKLWSDIESIHYHIWESHEEPIELGYNMDEYIDIEELVQITNNADSVQVLNTSTVQLPKITIPRFSGHVLEWTQFYDIFSKMIDNQTLSI